MPSTFFGLQIASNALAAQQAAINVTGNNIANSSNANYTRQVANFETATPYTFPLAGNLLTIGEGANIGSVTRARDAFVDNQYRTQNSLLSYWTQQQDGLNKIQNIMNEPSDNGLSNTLNTFWSDWSTLANNAQDSAARTTVQQQALTLADTFNQISSQISDLKTSYESAIKTGVDQINTIAQEISQLNVQINKAEASGTTPNDLMDQRDALVDQLSQYYQVNVVQTQQGAVSNYEVKIGDNDLVDGANYNTLTTSTTGTVSVYVNGTQYTAKATDGEPISDILQALQTATADPTTLQPAFTFTVTGNTVNISANGSNPITFGDSADTSNALKIAGLVGDTVTSAQPATCYTGDVLWDSVNTTNATSAPTPGEPVGSGDGSGANTGSVKGNLDNITQLNALQQKYDNLAQGIADGVNQLQNQGINNNGQPGGSGQSFFTYNTAVAPSYASQGAAASLQVNSAILNDPNNIAAADPTGGGIPAGTASITVGGTTYPPVNVAAGATLSSVLNALQQEAPGTFTYSISGETVTITNNNSSDQIVFGSSDSTNIWGLNGAEIDASATSSPYTINSPSSSILSNGSNAQSIADLQNGWSSLQFTGNSLNIPELPTTTNPTPPSNANNPVFSAVSLSGYYGSLVSGIGVNGQQANNMVTNQQSLVNNLSNQRQSVSGVSIDEEMTNMIAYQKTYTAAARVVTMMDDMLNTLVTGMGVTR